jgi:HK97 family phage portal protein
MKLPSMFRRAPAAVEVKASLTAATLVTNPGQPVWTPRDYRAFADEGYARNVIAYQAINRIADAVASVEWLVFRGDTELTAHPLIDLINRPNPDQGRAEYLRAKVGYYLIAGNSYEERVTIGGVARELYQLRPDRMKVIPSASGAPAAYEYKVGQQVVRYPVDVKGLSDISHMRAFNPVNDWYGLSPIEPSMRAIDQHSYAQSWVVALLQNSARPSGALAMKEGQTLSDDQFNRLKAQIEENYSGSRNAGRPMLLEGGLEWQQMGLGPTDMGIDEAKNSAARDIALAFGVPPQMLGIPGDNTYSNYQEARLAFWEDTVIPLVELIAQDWTDFLGVPQGVKVRADYDKIPAIVDKKMTLWAMADASTDLTVNERRELKGFQPIKGGEKLPGAAPPMPALPPIPGAPEESPPEDGPTPEQLKAIAYGLGVL